MHSRYLTITLFAFLIVYKIGTGAVNALCGSQHSKAGSSPPPSAFYIQQNKKGGGVGEYKRLGWKSYKEVIPGKGKCMGKNPTTVEEPQQSKATWWLDRDRLCVHIQHSVPVLRRGILP